MRQKGHIVVHYDEIGLKGENRSLFEKQLMANLFSALKKHFFYLKVKRSWGRIFIEGEWNIKEKENIRKKLTLLPGISHFGFVKRVEKSKEALLSTASFLIEEIGNFSFRISAKRVNKDFPLNSREIEITLGTELFRYRDNLKVDLKNYEKECIVKVLENEILVFIKEKGIGGLPISSSGAAVALLSAGFDSPVASFLMMKRGVKIYPIHFHAREIIGEEAILAVEDIVKKLSFIQGKTPLALVPILAVQKFIRDHVPEKLRIVFLRRSFLRLAEQYARSRSLFTLVTGDSVGQVASQTLENMLSIRSVTKYNVISPLSGLNKNEIITIARRIGTAEISARPCEDTCSLFVPKHPETKSQLEEVQSIEKEFLPDLQRLEKEAFENIDIRILE